MVNLTAGRSSSPRPLRFFSAASAILVLLLALAGCNPFKAKPAATKGVQQFHEQLGREEFSAIYEAAHDEFKKAMPKENFLGLVSAVHRKLGTITSSQETSWNINSHNMQTSVVLVYDTKFSGGDATETFVFRVKDEQATLYSYDIHSMALITK